MNPFIFSPDLTLAQLNELTGDRGVDILSIFERCFEFWTSHSETGESLDA